MELPDQDQTLLQDYTNKIEGIKGETYLSKMVGESIDALLRRASDLPFAEVMKDDYITSIIGCDLVTQKNLAIEVIATVIKLRPEIAAAWHEWRKHNNLEDFNKWYGKEQRHTAPTETPKPTITTLRTSPPAEYEFVVVEFVKKLLLAKFSRFDTKPQPFPNMAYYHTDGFFLSHASVREAVVKFVTDGLMVLRAAKLDKEIYSQMQALNGRYDEYLKSKTPAIMQMLNSQMVSCNKTLLTRSQTDALGPRYKIIKKQIEQVKKHSIFGVSFALGTTTVVKNVKVAVDRDSLLTSDDREAIALQELFDGLRASLPISVPLEFDLNFIEHFLDFDADKFGQWSREILGLAQGAKGNKSFLDQRIEQMRKELKGRLPEVVLLKTFFSAPERAISVDDLFKQCITVSELREVYEDIFPFIVWELTHRPRELAIQIREGIKNRTSVNNFEMTIGLLFRLRAKLSADYHENFEVAAAILNGFELVFRHDAKSSTIVELGTMTANALTATPKDRDEAQRKLVSLYSTILADK